MAYDSKIPCNFTMLEYIPLGVFVLRKDYVVLFWNSLIEEWTGIKRDKIIGTKIFEHFPYLNSPKYINRLISIFAGGPPVIFSSQLHKHLILSPLPNNQFRIQHTTVTALQSVEADFHALFTIQDVTDMTQRIQSYRKLHDHALLEIEERKRMSEKLQLTQFCVDKASIGIFRISEAGEIKFANDLACRSLGYTPEELYSITIFEIDPTFNLERFHEHRRTLRCDGFRTFETIHRRKDGSTFPVEITVNYLEYRDKWFTVSFAKDISERKMAEEQLRQKKWQLEELNRTLRQRVKTEVAKNREKDIILIQQNRQAALGETLEHIIHQWKQPLTTIGILVQNLESNYSEKLLTDDFVRETVDKTMDLLKHMAQTAEVFMDYYKPEKEKRVFQIKKSLEEAISFVEPAFRQQYITVELDADPELAGHGFPKEFVQVLLIILNNARDAFKERHTEKPCLAIKAFAEGKRAVVTVTDNAGGIAERAIGKVFDLYFTTKVTTGGTGIGLHMAKSIIEKHMKGSLSVTNVDGGARFRIEICAPRHCSG
jgi:PAS domain S-box-containing protein